MSTPIRASLAAMCLLIVAMTHPPGEHKTFTVDWFDLRETQNVSAFPFTRPTAATVRSLFCSARERMGERKVGIPTAGVGNHPLSSLRDPRTPRRLLVQP